MLDKVTVEVPATTANLGSGFDSLGMALDIYNEVSVERSNNFSIEIAGEGAGILPQNKDNVIYRSIATIYDKVGIPVPELSIRCKNTIPLRRGLGSSAAAIVGAVVAANSLCGKPLSPDELLQIAALTEGHADNVVPALFGGCQVIVEVKGQFIHAGVSVPPELVAVLFVPELEVSTEQSRTVLPIQVSLKDAVYNVGRAALLVNSFATGQLHYLRIASQDRLHQQARQVLFPSMNAIMEAALEAGAWAAFLSGSGSTIVALASRWSEYIGEEMYSTAQRVGVTGKIWITQPSLRGAIHEKNPKS